MSQTETFTEKSFGRVLRELGTSATQLIHNEVALFKSELQVNGDRLLEHGTQLAIWGGLLALSVIPFLAFLVIGLGRLLDDRYWLSSLIVAVVCAGVSGVLARQSLHKIKAHDLNFKRSKHGLRAGAETVKEKIDDVRKAAKGEYYEPAEST